MSILNLKNFSLHYEYKENKNKPVIIFSNSLGTNLNIWNAQAELLAPHFSILRYDKRGHGKSSAPSGPYTMEELAEDVVFLMEELKISKAHFVGISIGGMIGQVLAAYYPEKLDKIVLVCTSATQKSSISLWDARIKAVQEKGLKAVATTIGNRWLTEDFQKKKPSLVKEIVTMVQNTQKEGYLGCCYAIRNMDLQPLHKKIKNPVFIIGGKKDIATPIEQSHLIKNNIASSELLEIDGPHLIHLEKQKELNLALSHYFKIAQ